MNSKAIVYITSSREDPGFEAKIRANILKQKGDLPIISVSQKPIDFGHNICIGDVGHTAFNAYRQLLVGAKAAEAEYIVCAEADFLHHESYFNFQPNGGDIYRFDNVWILYRDPKIYSFRRKDYTMFAQIIKRKYLIDILEKNLNGWPMWSEKEIVFKKQRGYDMFRVPFEFFSGKAASISFKTGDGLRRSTNVLHGRDNIKMKLPYWGHVADIRKIYLNQNV